MGKFFKRDRPLGFLNPADPWVDENPFVGFINHPLIQLPHFDYIPKHLRQAAKP